MTSEPADLNAVTEALWRQREALARLASAIDGFGDLDAALDELRTGEVLRSAETEELTRALGLPVDASLERIAALSAEPWQTMLLDHLVALRQQYTDVTACAALTGRRLRQQSLDDFLR